MCEEVMRMIDDGCPNVGSADEQVHSEEMHSQAEDDLLDFYDDDDRRVALWDLCRDEICE